MALEEDETHLVEILCSGVEEELEESDEVPEPSWARLQALLAADDCCYLAECGEVTDAAVPVLLRALPSLQHLKELNLAVRREVTLSCL